jgi:2-methylcitrate dehydratase PrpD
MAETAAQILGAFAAGLKYEDIPSAVVERAKDCIIDSVACARFGAQFPWSRMVVDYARRYGSGGPCTIMGTDVRVHAPYAALVNGVHTHAFEQDGAHYPSVGAHGGATVWPAVLATCEETGADGKTAVTAFVAGCEVMFRIGAASRHTPEKLGFHAPGLSAAYGAAIGAGRVLGHDATQMANALGIAGSLSSGLLAFSKAKQGGMVKRLHPGRGSESGILASRLAASGFSGPETVLEGKFGYLDVYCREPDPTLLTKQLHQDWATSRTMLKQYAAQGHTHTSIQSMRALMAEHNFSGRDIAHVLVEGVERLVTHHNILEPGDIMQAQYSVPFCVAVAMFRDPADPRSFTNNALDDPDIRAACRSVEMRVLADRSLPHYTTQLTVRLKDGREFTRKADSLKGMPANPLTRDDLFHKLMFTAGGDEAAMRRLFERLAHLENEARFAL